MNNHLRTTPCGRIFIILLFTKKRETKIILLLLEIEVQNELIRREANTIEPKTKNNAIS